MHSFTSNLIPMKNCHKAHECYQTAASDMTMVLDGSDRHTDSRLKVQAHPRDLAALAVWLGAPPCYQTNFCAEQQCMSCAVAGCNGR